jgi:hypothetical protein
MGKRVNRMGGHNEKENVLYAGSTLCDSDWRRVNSFIFFTFSPSDLQYKYCKA